jgi:nitrogen-specific signal transduction histidine kinase/CheY-like chemotaxis protein
MVGIVEDVSERRQLEDNLRHMEKMDAIGQLAGGVAHDFNNQLGGIMGCADLLLNRLQEPKLQKYATDIIATSQRCADLTRQLLAFARKGQLQRIPVNIHLVLTEVAAILEHSIDKKINLVKHFKAKCPFTTGDPSQLQNALLNLSLNARDAMPQGGDLIFETSIAILDETYCASLPYEVEPGKYISISVTDTGVGMDAEIIRHIFEPFYTTKEVGKGTGMGLAAVYGTIKSHSGAINVYSELGHGTTFRLYLPLSEEEQGGGAEGKMVEPMPHSLRVLVVDDDDLLRNLAGVMLEELGCKVRTCINGLEGVKYYAKNWREIDLVILDMIMPVMNGRDAFLQMKKINPAVLVLLASGYSINGEAQELIQDGVHGFIQKPFRQIDLERAVSAIVNSNK